MYRLPTACSVGACWVWCRFVPCCEIWNGTTHHVIIACTTALGVDLKRWFVITTSCPQQLKGRGQDILKEATAKWGWQLLDSKRRCLPELQFWHCGCCSTYICVCVVFLVFRKYFGWHGQLSKFLWSPCALLSSFDYVEHLRGIDLLHALAVGVGVLHTPCQNWIQWEWGGQQGRFQTYFGLTRGCVALTCQRTQNHPHVLIFDLIVWDTI